jgi:hypothetical protein
MPSGSSPESRSNLIPGAGAGSESGSVARRYTHGAYAALPRERVDEKVLEVAAALSEDAPIRKDGELPPYDTVAVYDLAEVMCRLDDIGAYLTENGWHAKDGKPRPILEYEASPRRHKLDLLRELGMTPLARAKLLGQLDPGRGKKRSALDDFIHGEPKE